MVISNCVFNLVLDPDKPLLVREIFRVLRPSGRFAFSDVVSAEPVPEHLKLDPDRWRGCASGTFHEREILERFESAGFYGLAIEYRSTEPFAVVEGIEFHSITVTGRKGRLPCLEACQTVVYRGPWRRVEDDHGHVFLRGERTAVCLKTYCVLTSKPYSGEMIAVSPHAPSG